ncbi:Hypothetical protein LBF_3036 [Leptospira biflexa serovar Patoc strain 'Patoc 1 (Ames)']|uniref:Lipoprotein n=1 Tax=Leptospira biflexa serovar Patoc (strain Patoc 1 / ATCC 23582 / Paris) TaxID=456481 RepID=B0SQ58_LEPBP|nr:hypothetical protein [Leptospira biflexa]ABZ95505.1 Hypothetical protein LBF_3036 [Leptospira biflexa serovar Patoc strain 'Patoc 1 (Ames)']ABZ99210.1 Hypothetical protein; putative signal peptide [Leptospira biflexa serovar Patoc strain 'Patoc 1 (Paris)']
MVRKTLTYLLLFGIFTSVSCDILKSFDLPCLSDEFVSIAIEKDHQNLEYPCEGEAHDLKNCFCQKDVAFDKAFKFIKPIVVVIFYNPGFISPLSIILDIEFRNPEFISTELYSPVHLTYIKLQV